MSEITLPVGMKYVCDNCGAHVFTLQKAISSGQQLTESHIHPSEGQAPWRCIDRMQCRKCGEPFFLLSHCFKSPESSSPPPDCF